MSNDIHDIEWTCTCSHVNPVFANSCNGCGQKRYSESEGHTATVSALFAKAVHDRLTIGEYATRSHSAYRDSLLNEEETEELVEAYLLGTPAIEFAARLERRDLAAFEATIDRADEERPIGGALPQGARGAPWAELTASLAPHTENE